jgi:hypothetical protein
MLWSSREEIIALAKKEDRPSGKTSAPRIPPPYAPMKPRDSFVPEVLAAPEPPGGDSVPLITEDDLVVMQVVREWRSVPFTAAALGLVVLLWLSFLALRWVARGFVSHA